MTNDREVDVSVVIPCLNEANSIGSCIDKAVAGLKSAEVRGEILVVDNGSTDGSPEIALSHGARVVHESIRGYGSAVRRGFQEARGAFVIKGDADDSYDFTEIPLFVAKWREGYEVVMGNRLKGDIKPGAMPFLNRYIGTPVLTGILNLFFRAGIGDTHCGLRAATKEAFQRMDLRTTGMDLGPEFVIKAAMTGSRMTEVPISFWPDKRGRPPHLRRLPDAWRNLRLMLLFAPNWSFMIPGASLVAFGLALVFWLLPGPRQVGQVVLGLNTMFFGMIFTLLGVQIVYLGLFAKGFSYSERFNRHQRSLERWLRTVTLERCLLAGLGLLLIGLAGDGWVFWRWASKGFGPLNATRHVIFFSLWLFLGVQIIFSSLFLSMLGISRGTYIGDYDRK
jgi:glycosyltransferase involved in cell wall biosynthesis